VLNKALAHMSFQRFIILMLLAFTTICRAETTNSFGIYLTAEPVDRRITGYGKGDWSRIRLAESPLISAADIISYDFANHVIRLGPEALARIPQPPVEGTPFIVVVNGERIYLGAFTTGESSMTFGVPQIMVDRRSLVTNQPPDILVIERAYPSPSFGVGPDPRGDQRIKTALAALHKLKNDAALGSSASREVVSADNVQEEKELSYPLPPRDREIIMKRLARMEKGMTVKEAEVALQPMRGFPQPVRDIPGNNSFTQELGDGWSLRLNFANPAEGGLLVSAKLNPPLPYEIVLSGEKVVFDKAESVSIQITIRNLGMKKLIAPDLYSGLSVVWDGKEYKLGVYSWGGIGPYEIIPKGYWSRGFSLSDCLVPAEALTAGRHTIALKDAFAESNTLTVFIDSRNP